MNIDDMVSGKNNNEVITVGGINIPVSALKNFMEEGYDQLQAYEQEKTISMWGKTCTGCFTEQEIREKAGLK